MSHENPFSLTQNTYPIYPEPSPYFPPHMVKPEDRLPPDPELKIFSGDAVRVNPELAALVAAYDVMDEGREAIAQLPIETTKKIGTTVLELIDASH